MTTSRQDVSARQQTLHYPIVRMERQTFQQEFGTFCPTPAALGQSGTFQPLPLPHKIN
jgi:hypothetical protein